MGNQVLYGLAKKKLSQGGGIIACWSCGCARGEEAYGLLLLWRHRLKKHFKRVDLRVIGTDAHAEQIEDALQALYPRYALQDLPQRWIDRNFRERPTGFALLKDVKDWVSFRCELPLDVIAFEPNALSSPSAMPAHSQAPGCAA